MPFYSEDILSLPLGRHFVVLSRMYYGAFTKMLEQPDLDKYFTVLLMISNHPEKCTQQCLSKTGQIDKAQVTHILDELIEKGYVQKAQNPDDRREYLIHLTEKGQQLIPKIKEAMQQLLDVAFADVSEDERTTFLKVLQSAYCNLSELPANPVTIQVVSNKKQTK